VHAGRGEALTKARKMEERWIKEIRRRPSIKL
jgi:hypothetical protein